jgi:endonuclease/exonuclease/phosphatase family metal-dependent hydrolase
MKKLKVMTYNVCWEALESAKGNIDMSKCKSSSINKCIINIRNIISNKIEDEYDFICLQEINSMQWKKLSKDMILDNYNMTLKEINPAGLITIYNKKHTLLKKYSGNLIDSNLDKRPYMILLFSNNIVLINLHMPHIKQELSFEIVQNKLLKMAQYINKKTTFIICGDFNNNQPLEIPTFYNLLKPFNRKINIEPKKINTCCIPNDKKYKLSYDHIFISSNAKYIVYKTINKTEKKKYMSDHIPLFINMVF